MHTGQAQGKFFVFFSAVYRRIIVRLEFGSVSFSSAITRVAKLCHQGLFHLHYASIQIRLACGLMQECESNFTQKTLYILVFINVP